MYESDTHVSTRYTHTRRGQLSYSVNKQSHEVCFVFTREVQPALDGGDLIKHMYGMNIAYIIYVSRVSTEYTLLVQYIY